jgi:hypothetical protein
MSAPEYRVELGDVTKVPSDLLLLKHAQGFYGADEVVSSILIRSRLCQTSDLHLKPDDFALIDTRGAMIPARVMLLGTPPLSSFGYEEMEHFAQRAVQILARSALPVKVVTTTVHGTGYGLDGGESLQRLVRGFQTGMAACECYIERIVFVTLGERAERILTSALAAMKLPPSSKRVGRSDIREPVHRPAVEPANPLNSPTSKKRIFVAMPYSDEFDNVYEFGIYPAVRNCGFICEKVDETHFTGDILARITQGIETASVVIADLTQARPNVYLEVGYAWGQGTPVIFLARKDEKLHFDVSTHRCIYYGKFSQLAKELEQLLQGLEELGKI